MELNKVNTNKVLYNLKLNFGVGTKSASFFIKSLSFNSRNPSLVLNAKQKNKINRALKKVRVNHFLKRYLAQIKAFNNQIKTYRSMRNNIGLPCRGQRTRTNSKTKKKCRKAKV